MCNKKKNDRQKGHRQEAGATWSKIEKGQSAGNSPDRAPYKSENYRSKKSVKGEISKEKREMANRKWTRREKEKEEITKPLQNKVMQVRNGFNGTERGKQPSSRKETSIGGKWGEKNRECSKKK